MTQRDLDAKLAELDSLLNDPEVRMDPHRVWSLLAEVKNTDGLAPCEVASLPQAPGIGPDAEPGQGRSAGLATAG